MILLRALAESAAAVGEPCVEQIVEVVGAGAQAGTSAVIATQQTITQYIQRTENIQHMTQRFAGDARTITRAALQQLQQSDVLQDDHTLAIAATTLVTIAIESALAATIDAWRSDAAAAIFLNDPVAPIHWPNVATIATHAILDHLPEIFAAQATENISSPIDIADHLSSSLYGDGDLSFGTPLLTVQRSNDNAPRLQSIGGYAQLSTIETIDIENSRLELANLEFYVAALAYGYNVRLVAGGLGVAEKNNGDEVYETPLHLWVQTYNPATQTLIALDATPFDTRAEIVAPQSPPPQKLFAQVFSGSSILAVIEERSKAAIAAHGRLENHQVIDQLYRQLGKLAPDMEERATTLLTTIAKKIPTAPLQGAALWAGHFVLESAQLRLEYFPRDIGRTMQEGRIEIDAQLFRYDPLTYDHRGKLLGTMRFQYHEAGPYTDHNLNTFFDWLHTNHPNPRQWLVDQMEGKILQWDLPEQFTDHSICDENTAQRQHDLIIENQRIEESQQPAAPSGTAIEQDTNDSRGRRLFQLQFSDRTAVIVPLTLPSRDPEIESLTQEMLLDQHGTPVTFEELSTLTFEPVRIVAYGTDQTYYYNAERGLLLGKWDGNWLRLRGPDGLQYRFAWATSQHRRLIPSEINQLEYAPTNIHDLKNEYTVKYDEYLRFARAMLYLQHGAPAHNAAQRDNLLHAYIGMLSSPPAFDSTNYKTLHFNLNDERLDNRVLDIVTTYYILKQAETLGWNTPAQVEKLFSQHPLGQPRRVPDTQHDIPRPDHIATDSAADTLKISPQELKEELFRAVRSPRFWGYYTHAALPAFAEPWLTQLLTESRAAQ